MEIGDDELMKERRATDTQQEKIDTLIEGEPDHKSRLMLMVISNINKAILANTELTYAIHKEVKSMKIELDTHVIELTAAQNQAKGATRVMRIAGPVLWSILAASVGTMFWSYDNFQADTISALSGINIKIEGLSTKLSLYHPDFLGDNTGSTMGNPPSVKPSLQTFKQRN